jgi:hypothetical protein
MYHCISIGDRLEIWQDQTPLVRRCCPLLLLVYALSVTSRSGRPSYLISITVAAFPRNSIHAACMTSLSISPPPAASSTESGERIFGYIFARNLISRPIPDRVLTLHVSFRFTIYRMGLGRRGGVEANVDPVEASSIDVGVAP